MGCGASSNSNIYSNAPQSVENRLKLNDEPPAKAPMQPEPPLTRPDEMNEEEKKRIGQALRDAAKDDNIEKLGQLLSTDEGRACINEANYEGEYPPLAPLHWQLLWEDRFLNSDAVATKEVKDHRYNTTRGWSPLHWAVSYSKQETVKLLVNKGADANGVSSFGTPLTFAARLGYNSIAEYLLSRGASKEKAMENAHDTEKVLVEGFFVELERIMQNRLEFKSKRKDLQTKMMSSEKPETLPTTCKGITIGGLRRMEASIQSECEAGRFKEDKSFPDGTQCKGTVMYKELTTTDIVYRYVKDESVSGNLRLIDKPGIVAPEHKAMPTFFISHAWKGRFSMLLGNIFAYADRHSLSDDTAVWIDVFSVNQHGSKECSEFSQAQNQTDVASFKDVVQTCIDGTLVVCDFKMCVTSSRAWCLYEWDWTIFYHGREKIQFLGLSDDEAMDGIEMIDVQKAECFMAGDRAMILREIVNKHGSTAIFNDKIRQKWADATNPCIGNQ